MLTVIIPGCLALVLLLALAAVAAEIRYGR
jgi:hypothetical protein